MAEIIEQIFVYQGREKMMCPASVGLIYVSDYSKMTSIFFKDDNRKWFTSGADTGFISQNVYLYCATANLCTAVLGLVDKDKLHEIIGLSENEKVVYTQVIGKIIDLGFRNLTE